MTQEQHSQIATVRPWKWAEFWLGQCVGFAVVNGVDEHEETPLRKVGRTEKLRVRHLGFLHEFVKNEPEHFEIGFSQVK